MISPKIRYLWWLLLLFRCGMLLFISPWAWPLAWLSAWFWSFSVTAGRLNRTCCPFSAEQGAYELCDREPWDWCGTFCSARFWKVLKEFTNGHEKIVEKCNESIPKSCKFYAVVCSDCHNYYNCKTKHKDNFFVMLSHYSSHIQFTSLKVCEN